MGTFMADRWHQQIVPSGGRRVLFRISPNLVITFLGILWSSSVTKQIPQGTPEL